MLVDIYICAILWLWWYGNFILPLDRLKKV